MVGLGGGVAVVVVGTISVLVLLETGFLAGGWGVGSGEWLPSLSLDEDCAGSSREGVSRGEAVVALLWICSGCLLMWHSNTWTTNVFASGYDM